MQTYLASFVVAALAGSALTPIARRLSVRWGAVSTPGGRHIHGQAIARLGGLGIFAAFMVTAVAMMTPVLGETLTPTQLLGAAITLVGVYFVNARAEETTLE
jgi:UDP-GlcNAc:undecaprenyl-phosphate GlcNAc-1-phosphate transferase